jgi:hypothetical protein
MNMIKNLLSVTLLFLLIGCAGTTQKMNQVSLGMTKDQVIGILGSPRSSAGSAGVEVLRYTLISKVNDVVGHEEYYFVALKNGQVQSYGKWGDFGSAQDPTLNLNITHR